MTTEVLSPERRLYILQSFKGEVCEGCGGCKTERKSHCTDCYWKLPDSLRRRLHKGFGKGYEQAFEESLVVLNVRVKRPKDLDDIRKYASAIADSLAELIEQSITEDVGLSDARLANAQQDLNTFIARIAVTNPQTKSKNR